MVADFCWECWNKVHKTNAPKHEFVLSWEKDLCEECGQWKRVIILVRSNDLRSWFKFWEEK